MSNKVEQFNEKLDHVKRFLQETERINPSEEARESFLENIIFMGKSKFLTWSCMVYNFTEHF